MRRMVGLVFAAIVFAVALACAPAWMGRYRDQHQREWLTPPSIQNDIRPGLPEARMLELLGLADHVSTSAMADMTLHHYEFCSHLHRVSAPEGETAFEWNGSGWDVAGRGRQCREIPIARTVRVVTNNGVVSQVYY